LGSALVDTFYGAIAAFSISFVIALLTREETIIRLAGGGLLILIGVVYYFKRPRSLQEERGESEGKELASTALLTATNPTTVLSFLVVLSALGLGSRKTWDLTLMSVGGIFAGSMLWWTILTGIVNRFRDRFNDHAALWMNRIAGVAIGIFGLVTMLTSRLRH
jgi:threonine/homoserine/homoserine lactone efflux protein